MKSFISFAYLDLLHVTRVGQKLKSFLIGLHAMQGKKKKYTRIKHTQNL